MSKHSVKEKHLLSVTIQTADLNLWMQELCLLQYN